MNHFEELSRALHASLDEAPRRPTGIEIDTDRGVGRIRSKLANHALSPLAQEVLEREMEGLGMVSSLQKEHDEEYRDLQSDVEPPINDGYASPTSSMPDTDYFRVAR